MNIEDSKEPNYGFFIWMENTCRERGLGDPNKVSSELKQALHQEYSALSAEVFPSHQLKDPEGVP